jgi:hypothetical protein
MKRTFFSKLCLVCLLVVFALFISHHAYAFDLDGDGYEDDVDCNDADPSVYPGATETCNGVDDDCSGVVDDIVTYYPDIDSDGYGDSSSGASTGCEIPEGSAANNTDCSDTNAAINPAATETCDEVDNDCDGETDEDLTTYTWYNDEDGDDYGDAEDSITTCHSSYASYVSNSSDCDDTSATTGAASTWYADSDGDTYGDAATTQTACTQPEGYVTDNTDTDDTDATIFPGASGNDDDDDGDGDDAGDAATASAGCFLNPLAVNNLAPVALLLGLFGILGVMRERSP